MNKTKDPVIPIKASTLRALASVYDDGMVQDILFKLYDYVQGEDPDLDDLDHFELSIYLLIKAQIDERFDPAEDDE